MSTIAAQQSPPRQSAPWAIISKIARSYYVARLIKAFITAFVVMSLSFLIVRLMPGSPVEVYIYTLINQYSIPYAEAAQQAAALFGVNANESMISQYLGYLGGLLHGNLGTSLLSPGTSVSSVMMAYLPWTLFSVSLGLSLSFVLGITLGMLTAYRRESAFDHVLSFLGSLFSSIPNYIIGILLIVFLGIQWGIFDVGAMRGSYSPGVVPAFSLAFLGDILLHASLPVATYVLTTVGSWMLTMKSSTISTLGEDYVTVARARGLGDWRIMSAYVGRNAVIPLVAQLAISVGFIVGGSILIETLFVYQGIGYILGTAIARRDYTVMQGIFLVITVSVITANLLADLLIGRIDPRVRIEGDNGG